VLVPSGTIRSLCSVSAMSCCTGIRAPKQNVTPTEQSLQERTPTQDRLYAQNQTIDVSKLEAYRTWVRRAVPVFLRCSQNRCSDGFTSLMALPRRGA
jgi:hypothetical protein